MVKFEIRITTNDAFTWDWELVRHETVSDTEEVVVSGESRDIKNVIVDSVYAFGKARAQERDK